MQTEIIQQQLINKARESIDKWISAFNFNLNPHDIDLIKNYPFCNGVTHFGERFDTSEYPARSADISREISPIFGIRGENSSGIPGTDCFVTSLEGLDYGTLAQRNQNC